MSDYKGELPGLQWCPKKRKYFAEGCSLSSSDDEGGEGERGGARSSIVEAGSSPRDLEGVLDSLRQSAPSAEVLKSLTKGSERQCKSRRGRKDKAEEQCPICFEAIQNACNSSKRTKEVDTLELPCGHVFHSHCLTTWAASKGSCPSCREPIDMALAVAARAALGGK